MGHESLERDITLGLIFHDRCDTPKAGLQLTTGIDNEPQSAYYFNPAVGMIWEAKRIGGLKKITFCFWYKRMVVNRFMPLIASHNSSGGAHPPQGFQLAINADNKIYFVMTTDKSAKYETLTTNPLPVDELWHHIVFQFDGTKPLKSQCDVYIDAVRQGMTDTPNLTLFGEMQESVDNATSIGYTKNYYGEYTRLEGILDEIRFYNRILTQLEVNDVFNAR